MGYPMTFQRFVNRNHLGEGDYTDGGRWSFAPATSVAPEHLRVVSEEHVKEYYDERLERCESEMRMLLGDLRRLEQDAIDENAICSTRNACVRNYFLDESLFTLSAIVVYDAIPRRMIGVWGRLHAVPDRIHHDEATSLHIHRQA